MSERSFGIVSPTLGIKQDYPSIFLKDAYLPDALEDSEDIFFRYGEIHRIKKRSKEFSQQLPDQVLHYNQYWQKDLDWWLLLCTKRDIAYRDETNDRLVYITPQYSTGALRVENGSAEIYGGVDVDDCSSNWGDLSGGDVTPELDSTDFKEGAACVKLTVAASAGVENLAYNNISSLDLSGQDAIGFWFKSSVALDSGDLQFLLDDTNNVASPVETINFPSISADTWTWVEIDLADPSNCSAILSLGIKQAVDKGAMVLRIDQVVAGDWEGQLNANDFITIGTSYSTDDTWYEVSVVTDTHITLTAVYAGSTAYQQAYLARQTYAGTNTDHWESVTFNNKWIAVNGVNNPQVWTGTGQCADLGGSPPVARHIFVFENYVVLGNLSGTSEPYTYQWCSIGAETNWSTGDSGSAEIDDYFVLNGFGELDGFLIILTERTLEKVWLVGGSLVFNRRRVTSDVGAWAPKSIVQRAGAIYFYAADNTYRCFTGFTWDAVSRPIDKFMKNIHPEYEKYMQATYVEEFNLILVAVPDTTSTGRNNKVLMLDLNAPLSSDKWSIKAMEVCSFGFYEAESSLTWNTLPFSTWDSWAWDRWDNRFGFQTSPHELAADYSGYTYQMFASETDDGSDFTGKFTLATDLTKNKKGSFLFKRLTQIQAIFRNEEAGTVDVYVKKDYEPSWTLLGSISLDGSQDILFLDVNCNLVAKNFLFKFSATNKFRFLGIVFPEYELIGIR